MENIYFTLTEAFNREAPTVALASGQAVVFYRIAIMSKDGDWVIRETPEACGRVLTELANRGARYRIGAPLDVRWLVGGWSSHFELFDEKRRRVRCDFVSRPPRVPPAAVAAWFARPTADPLMAVDPESLILMKQTQRAKDYAVIGELATLLPPERRSIHDGSRSHPGAGVRGRGIVATPGSACCSERRGPAIRGRGAGGEIDALQLRDSGRLKIYEEAAAPYLAECRAAGVSGLPLPDAHPRLCELAERLLPNDLPGSANHADVE